MIDLKCGKLTLVLMSDLNNSISLLILSIVLLVFLTLLLRIWRCVLQMIFHSFNCLNCLKLSLILFGTTFFLRHLRLKILCCLNLTSLCSLPSKLLTPLIRLWPYLWFKVWNRLLLLTPCDIMNKIVALDVR